MRKILQILLVLYFVKCSTSICVDDLCKIFCEYGYVVVDGCQICQCIDPCSNHTCGIDEYCEVEPVPCYLQFDCGYKTTCVKKCGKFECPLNCTDGYELDCNNCPTCKCRNPCKGVVCPLYHYCMEEIIFCLIPPCQPPFVVCKHYCPPNQKLLIDDSGLPVECTSQKCPNNYDCTTVPFDSRSFCCSILT